MKYYSPYSHLHLYTHIYIYLYKKNIEQKIIRTFLIYNIANIFLQKNISSNNKNMFLSCLCEISTKQEQR